MRIRRKPKYKLVGDVSRICEGLAILALTDRGVREETQVIYDPPNGFVVTKPGGIWRFRRGNFGRQYLDENNFQHNDLDHASVNHHNADRMLREAIPGHDLPRQRWGLFCDGEDERAMESFRFLGAVWALHVQRIFAVRFMRSVHGKDWTHGLRVEEGNPTQLGRD